MQTVTSERRKTLSLLASFLGLLLLPLWLWAVRAPDGPYAPLPDYDIRGGYRGLLDLNDPRIAQEQLLLREQRAAKRAAAQATEEPAAPWIHRAELENLFGRDVSVEWNPNGTPRFLFRDERSLMAPQLGDDPVAAARHFLRMHPQLFRLSDEAVDGLAVADQLRSPSGNQHVTFRQTLDGVPIFQSDFKVSLTPENAVVSAGGMLFPELTAPPVAKLTAVDAARTAAGYVGPLGNPGKHWDTFEPKVLRTEPGAENRTFLSPGPFRRQVLASRVVFPLTLAQGRPAWQVYLMKSPMESYRVVVDAEDGTLLSRQSLVKFSVPQGLVFTTHPDDGGQVLASFVGNATASPNTFVDLGQSGLRGNNVIMGVGASDTSGPQHFEFTFTDDYEVNGLTSFGLNGLTLRFTPNLATGGYDLSLPAFFDPPTGTPMTFSPNSDDGSDCSTGPPTGFAFFGASVTAICISTNGNIIMGSTPDNFFIADQLSLALLPGRIMGLWHDFVTDGVTRTVGVSNPVAGQRCFRWNNVSEFGTSNSNSFAICLWGTGGTQAAGTIEMTYASVAATIGMVGFHPGAPSTPTTLAPPAGTAAYSELMTPDSTSGAVGFVQVYPNHADMAAAATNAFWILNELGHDRTYAGGFTETDGNMQLNNFGRGGTGNDPIVAASGFVFGGFFFNNAFFDITADGVCCPITAYGLFTAAAGFRDVDSAFDSDVVVHEHGHGVSTRLVGSLALTQGGAMGEGWSDWFALSYAGDPVMGEYVTGNSSTGIRGVRYDASSTRQFGDFGNIFGPFTTDVAGVVVFLPEVHDDGEIWATVLADVRADLLAAGVSNANIEKLIIEGLAATPPEPTMLSARDAIFTARPMVSGVAKCALWDAFAPRGLGKSAAINDVPPTGPGDAFSVFQAFNTPPKACGGTFTKDLVIQKAKFESALVNDTTADGWTGTGLWHVTARRASSGTQSFYYGQEGSGTYSTGSRTFGFLTSPIFNFSSADRPIMEFQLFLDTEELFPFDTLWLQVSTNGGTTWPIQRAIHFWNTGTAFRKVSIDLTPLRLQSNARIRFYFDTLDSFVNAFEGVYIDTIKITETTQN